MRSLILFTASRSAFNYETCNRKAHYDEIKDVPAISEIWLTSVKVNAKNYDFHYQLSYEDARSYIVYGLDLLKYL